MDVTSHQHGFNLGLHVAFHDFRKEFGKLRANLMDAMWEVNGNTRRRILDALNEFQENSDWNFDL